jgi:hypothetical protein
MGVIDCDAHVEESEETWQYLDLLRPIPLVFPEETCFGVHNAARDSTAKAQAISLLEKANPQSAVPWSRLWLRRASQRAQGIDCKMSE